MSDFLFYLVIFLSNTIQGVTGFAGTILAMPFSLQLVGYEVAVPVLNLLGVLAGIYVFAFNYKAVQWKELAKVVAIMAVCIMGGVALKSYLSAYDKATYIVLGVIVLIIAVQGIVNLIKESSEEKGQSTAVGYLLIAMSGLVHGMFVCGGPLLVGYLTTKIKDKTQFRATISTCWIFLNGLLLITHVKQGLWTPAVIKSGLYSIPALILGMICGSLLCKRMSQKLFLCITYILLLIAAVTLFLK